MDHAKVTCRALHFVFWDAERERKRGGDAGGVCGCERRLGKKFGKKTRKGARGEACVRTALGIFWVFSPFFLEVD